MKELTKLVSLLMIFSLCFVGCGDDKDEDTGVLSFDVPAVYLPSGGATVTIPFHAFQVNKLSVSSLPTGWPKENFIIDEAASTLTIMAPMNIQSTAEGDKEPQKVAKSGTIMLTAFTLQGNVKSARLFVGVVSHKDISSEVANCLMVHEPQTNYVFEPMKPNGEKVAATRVGILWQSANKLVQNVFLDGDKVSFYTEAAANKNTEILEGNALLGAYDKDGKLLWSWHIWSTNYLPESDLLTYQNGHQVMNRNLGALKNSNEKPLDCLASYGLFYQWGRKDPFVGPKTYRADKGIDAELYGIDGNRVTVKYDATTLETGTRQYANEHPLIYLTGVKDSGNDWLWTADNEGWAEVKTNNDPCPKGWKVAPQSAFDNLTVATTPQAEDAERYGLQLTDGTTTSLYMAAGRKVYTDGRFLNIYNPLPASRGNYAEEAQPWEGLYWTANTTGERQAATLHFWFQKSDTTMGVEQGKGYQRANGMNVRCVKE